MSTTGKIKYQFSEKVWQYEGTGGWYFISLPKNISKEIRNNLKNEEEGWGRLKATAEIGTTQWKTSIWYGTKNETYLLPLKSEIRKKEKIEEGMVISVTIIL